MSASPPFRPPRPRPSGNFKACPHCGMTGVKDRLTHWLGTSPVWDAGDCDTCSGHGWLPAPSFYNRPIREWPAV